VEEAVAWDPEHGGVLATRRLVLGRLVLREARLPDVDPARATRAALEHVRRAGLRALTWTRDAESLRARVAFATALRLPSRAGEADGAGWPDLSDAALLARLDDWLGPLCAGSTPHTPLTIVTAT
jgi:ATP-dependent helicase HrpB